MRTAEGLGGSGGGTVAAAEVTSGWPSGTSSGRRIWIGGIALLVGFTLLNLVVNAASQIDEYRRLGSPRPAWMPWTWETSSAIGWIAVMPMIAFAALRLRPPRLSWPATLAVQLALTVPVSLAHVGIMVVIRKAVHSLMGDWYRLLPNLSDALLYEWRKDAVNYLAMVVAFAAIDWLARRGDREPTKAAPAPYRIEVRDGTRTIFVAPADLLWAEAAGNYVELHTVDGILLYRSSLSALEHDLAPHGFARVHRSRIVRRGAVRAIDTNASGTSKSFWSMARACSAAVAIVRALPLWATGFSSGADRLWQPLDPAQSRCRRVAELGTAIYGVTT